jgi:hypothetical protein
MTNWRVRIEPRDSGDGSCLATRVLDADDSKEAIPYVFENGDTTTRCYKRIFLTEMLD